MRHVFQYSVFTRELSARVTVLGVLGIVGDLSYYVAVFSTSLSWEFIYWNLPWVIPRYFSSALKTKQMKERKEVFVLLLLYHKVFFAKEEILTRYTAPFCTFHV